MNALKILVIEDVESDYLILERHIRRSTLEADLRWARNREELDAELADSALDLVISDYKMIGLHFHEILGIIKETLPDVPVILLSGSVGEETAVELLKMGLSDFILKDSLSRLIPSIERSLGERVEIRKRKMAEEKLEQSERLMRSVLAGTNDAVFVKDLQGRYILINSAGARYVNRSEDDIIGRDDTDFFPSDIASRIMARDRWTVENRQTNVAEELIPSGDGSHRFFLVTKGPLIDQSGLVTGVFGVARDITGMKNAEASLKEQEEKYRHLSQEYRTLLDNVPDGIVHLSPDLKIQWINESARRMFSVDYGLDLMKHHCYEVIWKKSDQCEDCPAIKSIVSGRNEIRTLTSKETERNYEIRTVPVVRESGAVEGIIDIIRDVTEHRRLEEQFRQSQKMESIGTLAGGIAHDFNNILSTILGYGKLLIDEMGDDSPMLETMDAIMEAGRQASYLTRDLLLFSRKQVSDKRPVNLNQVIGNVEKFIRRIIGEDIQCVSDLDRDPLVVFAEAHQIGQVLMNFATNARDAMPMGGILSIRSRCVTMDHEFITSHGVGKPGIYAVVTISDTGRGMDEETAGKIFEPFFTTKEMGKGTGLGLAVVYGIVSNHEGYIQVESRIEKGTEFRIYLPVIGGEEHNGSKRDGAARQVRSGNETILLAEDEAGVRKLFSTVLKQKGYRVIEAVNGDDAVRMFEANRDSVDLLLFDLVMPVMDGKRAYDEICRMNRGMKCVFVSGYAPDSIYQEGLTSEKTEVVYKPLSPRELLRVIREVLDREYAG
jgi:PAS domain S-box-containing protein